MIHINNAKKKIQASVGFVSNGRSGMSHDKTHATKNHRMQREQKKGETIMPRITKLQQRQSIPASAREKVLA
jgi:hypothetical protein